MGPLVWIALVVAGLAVLFAARIWWSTSGARYRDQKEKLDDMERRLAKMDKEVNRYREADLMLREANRKLRDALTIREKEVAEREAEIKQLKKANTALHAANDKLNEVLGDQERHVQKLQGDVDMLSEQVDKLRAQLGLEP